MTDVTEAGSKSPRLIGGIRQTGVPGSYRGDMLHLRRRY